MSDYNRDEAERIAREMAEDDERATGGEWFANHGSWSSNVTTGTDLVAPSVRRPDGEAIARLRNNASAAAEQLRAAVAEVERLKALSRNIHSIAWAGGKHEAEQSATADRDRLAARIAALEAALVEACDIAESLSKYVPTFGRGKTPAEARLSALRAVAGKKEMP